MSAFSVINNGLPLVSQIVVVDNGSVDGSADTVDGFPKVTLIRAGGNLGIGKACNLGASRTESEFLLFLNPDARLFPKTLSTALGFMQRPENPKAVPSLSENVGGAVEPLLMEKPVVASRVGGLPDAVVDGRTGFLVPPADPRALADALLKAIDLPMARRREMGREGRTWVEANFDLCRVADAELALFEAQLAARQGRGSRRGASI